MGDLLEWTSGWSGHRRRGKMEHAGSWGGLPVKQEPRPQPAPEATYTDIRGVAFL